MGSGQVMCGLAHCVDTEVMKDLTMACLRVEGEGSVLFSLGVVSGCVEWPLAGQFHLTSHFLPHGKPERWAQQ